MHSSDPFWEAMARVDSLKNVGVGYYRDSKGMRYYARLLENPRKPHVASDLQDDFTTPDRNIEPSRGIDMAGGVKKSELQQQCDNLFAEMEAARANNDIAEVERLQKELHALSESLSTNYDKFGRSRRADDPGEQARKNVDGALRTAREKLRKGHPELARHLEIDVTGSTCLTYTPTFDISWNI